jgi:hypothetical protein
MSIEFHCSRCGRLLRTGDDTMGRLAQCPQCGAQTQVPIPETSGSASSVPPASGGGSFDARAQQPADSTGYQAPYQATAGQALGQVAQVNQQYALDRVSGPAVSLIVTAVLGLVTGVLGLVINILQIGVIAAAAPRHAAMPAMFSAPVYIVFGSIGIIMSIVVLMGAIKMKGLENYGLAMAASIIAIVPCTSPCCFLGLPFGIWALVVLCDPLVKASFRS